MTVLNHRLINLKRKVNFMSTVDKVKVGDTTYDVSPGATGSLNGYVSNDNGTPPPHGPR